jgi:hypothetical protein
MALTDEEVMEIHGYTQEEFDALSKDQKYRRRHPEYKVREAARIKRHYYKHWEWWCKKRKRCKILHRKLANFDETIIEVLRAENKKELIEEGLLPEDFRWDA